MTTHLPFVSLLMPIRNEAAFIERSLGAVLEQDYPAACLEILVADGMSTDGTRDLVNALAARHPHVRLIDNPGGIVSTGLNAATRAARGDVIIWIGGHTEIAPDFVRRAVDRLQSTDFDCVGGPIETVADTPWGAAIAVAMSSPFGVGGVAFRTQVNKVLEVDTVAFGAYRRAAMTRCGPLDEELVRNQDDEYNYRLRERGGKILLAPDIRSRYYSRSSLQSLWRQYFQYGFWKVRVLQKHPAQMQPRQFAPPLFAAALVGALALAVPSRLGRMLLGAVVGSYAAGNLVATAAAVRKEGPRHAARLPIIFATLHLSYGLGFLVGLGRFWNRWGDKRTRAAAEPAGAPQ